MQINAESAPCHHAFYQNRTGDLLLPSGFIPGRRLIRNNTTYTVDYDAYEHMPFGPFLDPPALAASFRGFLRERALGEDIGHIAYLDSRHGDPARPVEIGAIYASAAEC
ncbi:hypothetical protein DFJ73DRAFT_783743 [Zopfochytrium polystomum]|nr:hypothetical protein DFJ73DRAFT_783743 [Zopfochytrium polystomum]